MLSSLGRTVRAVTFDCWNTLIAQRPGGVARRRADLLAGCAREVGVSLEVAEAERLLDAAWRRHRDWMRAGRACGAPEITRWALGAAGVRVELARESELARAFAEASLDPSPDGEVFPLEGARDTLEELAARGVRRALICDTGYSPGHVVRQLLERLGLLEWLEVQVFSDEVGVPKPHGRMFQTALHGVAASAEQTIHVGDLRATDVAGARRAGMGTIRLRHLHDDRDDLPDADAVAGSHAELRTLLGVRPR